MLGGAAMTLPLSSKLPAVGTTIFTVMSRKAEEYGAINLSQGFPDFDAPDELRALLAKHVGEGRNQYPPMAGVMQLREQIALKVETLYGHKPSPEDEVTVVPGATEAIFCAVMAVVRPGDEVIVFDPAYDSYEPSITLSGGRTIHIPMQAPAFSIDWQRVRDAITPRTRAIMINSPHNPTGSIVSASDMATLAEITRDTPISIISDEVYEHLVYDGARHESVLRSAELAERSFAVFSFGKTFHATGWKTGYCVAPKALTAELRKVHQFVTFVAVAPIQYALADYMALRPEHCRELPVFYQAKRDRFLAGIEQSRFRGTPSAGTYFQLLDYSAISGRPDREMCEELIVKHGIASIPISVFCAEAPATRVLRFCFAKKDETLQRAAAILCRI
jgi:methionine aminotransferase